MTGKKTELSIAGQSFENLKKVNEYGAEYWSARNLQPLLGYSQWRRFEQAIERAITSCKSSGNPPGHHFAGAGKMVVVQGAEIAIATRHEQDYICLTDMLKAKDGGFFISDWLRNRNTVEFLGTWESLSNPDFNYSEFAIIRSQAGLNSYKLSVKDWVEKTHAIGLYATAGRYGGTYAHKGITLSQT
jgi:hypothetical protein